MSFQSSYKYCIVFLNLIDGVSCWTNPTGILYTEKFILYAKTCFSLYDWQSGLHPDQMDYINAHATSTPLGKSFLSL